MGLKSIDIVYKCPFHGNNIGVVRIADRLYCEICIRNKFYQLDIKEVVSTRIENVDETETMVCRHCGGQRHIDDRPCAICGGSV